MEPIINELYNLLEKIRGPWLYVPNSTLASEHWVTYPIEPTYEMDKYLKDIENKVHQFYPDAFDGYFMAKKSRIYGDRILLQAKKTEADSGMKYYVILWKPKNDLVSIAQESGHWKDVEKRGENFLSALSSITTKEESNV